MVLFLILSEFGPRRARPRRSAQVNLIIANEITPHLTAEEYMDKGEYENELKQVIGDTKAAYDISEHDTLVFGSYGLLVAGPNSRHHEPLLCAYLQFITIDIFMQNYFARSVQLQLQLELWDVRAHRWVSRRGRSTQVVDSERRHAENKCHY